VIPANAVIDFNFRFGTASTPQALQERLQSVLDRHALDYELEWTISGLPFLTPPGTLVDAVVTAIRLETGIESVLSTAGGTSDGRFIAKICPQVIELGPTNASIHQIDEYVPLADLEPLKNIYRRVLELLSAQFIP
jgi:succinyl-diaminopimelate desuccinylase